MRLGPVVGVGGADPGEDLGEQPVVGDGVLADVHGRQPETEGGDPADEPVERTVGDQLARVVDNDRRITISSASSSSALR